MGAGVVFVFWIFGLAIISAILGAICVPIGWIFCHHKQPKVKQDILRMSFFTPAIFLYSNLFLIIVGDILVGDKVSPSFGDEWWAPINEEYYLGAIDDPDSTYIFIRGEGHHMACDCRRVTNLWSTEDTVTLLCTNKGGLFSIYAFPIKTETFDTISYLFSQEQMDSALLKVNYLRTNRCLLMIFFVRHNKKHIE